MIIVLNEIIHVSFKNGCITQHHLCYVSWSSMLDRYQYFWSMYLSHVILSLSPAFLFKFPQPLPDNQMVLATHTFITTETRHEGWANDILTLINAIEFHLLQMFTARKSFRVLMTLRVYHTPVSNAFLFNLLWTLILNKCKTTKKSESTNSTQSSIILSVDREPAQPKSQMAALLPIDQAR